MCEYCKEDDGYIHGKITYSYDWENTHGYSSRKGTEIDYLEMWIMKCKKDKKAGIMIDNGNGARYLDINYCPMCGRKLS